MDKPNIIIEEDYQQLYNELKRKHKNVCKNYSDYVKRHKECVKNYEHQIANIVLKKDKEIRELKRLLKTIRQDTISELLMMFEEGKLRMIK
ncbi:MAG: hypothetical protein IJH39_03980 [Clostridia bacterium]|nr:hypothetical protein [Clostridia bacterium]